MTFLSPVFNEPRHYGNNNNRDNYYCKITFYGRDVAEKITSPKKKTNPRDATDDIKQNKFRIIHGANTGHERSKSADNGHELGDDDCFSAMLLIKFMRFLKIFFFKKTAVFVMKNFRPDKMANGIVDRVSGNSSNGKQNQQTVARTGFRRPGRNRTTRFLLTRRSPSSPETRRWS